MGNLRRIAVYSEWHVTMVELVMVVMVVMVVTMIMLVLIDVPLPAVDPQFAR